MRQPFSPPVSETRTAEPAVALREVTKVYGSGGGAVTALHEVTADFVPGSFTAVMGPSGSGKSTLLQSLTAELNVALPLRLAGRKPARGEVRDMLAVVGLADRARHRPSELSGGQQQRVAIARALVTKPSVVFADEPTGALDSTTGREVLSLLRELANSRQTVVMVTHDPVAAAYADRVVFLADGQIAGELHDPTVQSVAARMTGLEPAGDRS